MAAAHTGKGKPADTSKPAGTASPDAILLLERDHQDIAAWLADFGKADSDTRKAKLSEKICLALKVHMQIEEEIFYPASREALKSRQEDMIDEAVTDHAGARALIGDIEQMEVGEPLYDARIKRLGEMVARHVGDEEKNLFPACLRTEMDMKVLGERLAARKAELMRKLTRPNGHAVI